MMLLYEKILKVIYLMQTDLVISIYLFMDFPLINRVSVSVMSSHDILSVSSYSITTGKSSDVEF